MARTVYLYDGTPYEIQFDWLTPREPYTEIEPDRGLRYPIYFDEAQQKWVGSEPQVDNPDIYKLTKALDSQNDKLQDIIDKINRVEQDNFNLKGYIGDLILGIAVMKSERESKPKTADISTIKSLYESGIYQDFQIEQLLQAKEIRKKDFKEITGHEYEPPNNNPEGEDYE